MNKNLLIIGGVILVVAVGGYFLMNRGTSPISQTSNPQNDEQLVSVITNAFGGSGSIKCTYSDETSQGIAYIKNGMVKVESKGTDGAQYGNAIMKNDTLWTWETGGAEGFMMTNISQYQGDVPEGYSTDPNKIRAQIEQSRPDCNEENIADSVFEPPTNVKFEDFSSMMEDIQTPEGFELPEGVELPEGYTYPSN